MAGLHRRDFLRQSLIAGSAISSPRFLRGDPVAKSVPSERLRVGCIGVEGRAKFLLQAFAGHKEVDLVAIADVDSRKLPAAIETVKRLQGRSPQAETDFRRLIDNREIDAVVIGTPDHWHAIPSILACLAGKDVYVEKPDGHNLLEGQRMVEAARKNRRVVQLGTQSRSAPHFQEAIAFLKTGKLGKCLTATAWETAKQGSIGKPADSSPPAGVDYDFWLGPAPKRPFNVRRFHGNWRWFFDYGSGDLGNDGVHRLDYARWALSAAAEGSGDPPLTAPVKVSAMGGKWYFDDLQEWPDTLQVTYEFPGKPGRILTYEMRIWTPSRLHNLGEGAVIYGDQGYIVLSNTRWQAFGPDNKLLAEAAGSNDGTAHVQNFIDCVKSRGKPNADLETVGHPSSSLCHIGNVAWRTGRSVQFKSATGMFDDPAANALRTRPEYRKPWLLPEV